MDSQIEKTAQDIVAAGQVVALTGAGISAESGIKTFRAADGLWENHRVEDVASPEGFQRDPALVQRFYNERRKQLLSDEIQANAAHQALGQLEAEAEASVLLVTQNIDNLHERGGSQNLIHMHGELLKMRCVRSQQVFDIKTDIRKDSLWCAFCHEPSLMHHIYPIRILRYRIHIMSGDNQCDIHPSAQIH